MTAADVRYETLPPLRGQGEDWRRLLAAAHAGRLHHAVLLSGPRGAGKSLAARHLARALLCGPGAEGSAAAQRVARATHPDLHFVTLPDDRQDIPVDSVRGLQGELERTPVEGGARIAVVDPADRLNEQGQNALLKTLEEPSSATWLILVTSRPEGLLDTIRSRVWHERVLPLSDAEIIAELGLSESGDPAGRALLREAGGSLGLAQSALSAERSALSARLDRYLADATDDAATATKELLDGADDRRATEQRLASICSVLAGRARTTVDAATGDGPGVPAYADPRLGQGLATLERVLSAREDLALGLPATQVLEALLLALREPMG